MENVGQFIKGVKFGKLDNLDPWGNLEIIKVYQLEFGRHCNRSPGRVSQFAIPKSNLEIIKNLSIGIWETLQKVARKGLKVCHT